MEVLNKLTTQLTDLFKSMTPAARITTALLVVVVLLCLGLLSKDSFVDTNVYLLGGEPFSSSQLREMQVAFGKAGLEGYQIEGARIRVPRAQQSKFLAALADANALPADFGDHLQQAINGNNSLLPPSRLQQEAALKVASQRELQAIINEIPGIARSAVHIDQQISRSAFPASKTKITASVSVMPEGQGPLDEHKVPGIRALVAGWVAGLEPEAVTIIDLSTGKPYPGNSGDSPLGSAGGYAELKRQLERDWQEKIARVLTYIPGVMVTTNVELAPEISTREKLTEYETSSASADPRRALPTSERQTVREGRTPRSVTVSISIPSTYYENIWRFRHGGSSAEPDAAALAEVETKVKREVEDAITPLLIGHSREDVVRSQIAVTTFTPVLPPALPEPVAPHPAVVWLWENWQVVAIGVATLLGLIVVRFARRPAPQPAKHVLGVVADDESPDLNEISAAAHEPAAQNPWRDELVHLVRQNPDAAASVLRTWIGNAS